MRITTKMATMKIPKAELKKHVKLSEENIEKINMMGVPVESVSEEEIEQIVLDMFHKHEIRKKHWLLKEVMVAEIEYMLDALQILIEPDFSPG